MKGDGYASFEPFQYGYGNGFGYGHGYPYGLGHYGWYGGNGGYDGHDSGHNHEFDYRRYGGYPVHIGKGQFQFLGIYGGKTNFCYEMFQDWVLVMSLVYWE